VKEALFCRDFQYEKPFYMVPELFEQYYQGNLLLLLLLLLLLKQ